MLVRRSSKMFVVMGALLIALAALLRFVLVPMVSKLPGDLDVNPVYEGTGTLLNAQALQAGDIANVIASDVPVTIDCHIYVSSTDGDSALAHDDVTLTAPGLSVPSDHTYAIDRKTMDAANSYSGEGVEPHSGMTIALPLHPDPAASYQYYDSATRTTAPMIYVDSGSISGRDILNYTVEAKGALRDPAIARTLPPALPKSLLGILRAMPEVFSPWDSEEGIADVLDQVEVMISSRSSRDHTYEAPEVDRLLVALRAALNATGKTDSAPVFTEDMPVHFDPRSVPDHLEALLRTADFQRDAGYASSFLLRVKGLVGDLRHKPIIAPAGKETLEDWLRRLLGDETCANGEITVVDLSLLATEVMHTAVAVIGRLTMEALQHLRESTGTILPTVLVLEEAHNFVSAASSGAEIPTTADLCRETFNRIAREGRKFGLGLVLSSQRPSALSQTVLSQCNSFLLHRLVNDRDQELVARLVPDSLGDLLHELPSLAPRQAILMGWAAEIPTLVEIRNLESAQRPQSDDPRFWDTWTGTEPVSFTWEKVVEHWTT